MVKRRRSRQEALALNYPSAPCCRQVFERLYAEHCKREGKLVSSRALETRWVAYRGIVRCFRRQGGTFYTTNGQRSQQLANDGRARCERTVRRVHRDLEAMGLVIAKHKVRSGPARRPGQLDCLVVAMCPVRGQSYVRPPSGERGVPFQGTIPPLQRPLVPPAELADGVGPAAPAPPGPQPPPGCKPRLPKTEAAGRSGVLSAPPSNAARPADLPWVAALRQRWAREAAPAHPAPERGTDG